MIPACLMTVGAEHEITLAFLCCGALVKRPEKLDALRGIGER